MKFAIITHVIHGESQGTYFGYAPYVREMNVWLKHVDEVLIVAPLREVIPTSIDLDYEHSRITFRKVPEFHLLNFKSTLKAIFLLPKISFEIYQAMKAADHIHLRCPGNMGLLGCVVQLLFPKKYKTAKYAGNWDAKAKQPLSYRLQKWILNNTFLTKNMQVLVYGEWEKSSGNIKPFFTASYFEIEKTSVVSRNLKDTISFLFVGTLSQGKQPLYVVQLVEELKKKDYNVQLSLYGEGDERVNIEKYITHNQLENCVFIKGNQSQETIKKAYSENHFIVLPSLSEGWPKVVAEGMFWGCLPIASKVSCVPNMLGNGERGLLLNLNLNEDVSQIESLINEEKAYQEKVKMAIEWSCYYTFDLFDQEINKLLQS